MKMFSFFTMLLVSATSVFSSSTIPSTTVCDCSSPTVNNLYQPVCGHNGLTYYNKCDAICRGHTNMQYYGNCLPKETNAKCFDHKDNDGDGLVDCADPDCSKVLSCRYLQGSNMCSLNEEKQLQQVKKSCCKTKNCSKLPNQCSPTCSKTFVPYYKKCGWRFNHQHHQHRHNMNHKCSDKWGFRTCKLVGQEGYCKNSLMKNTLKNNCARTCGFCHIQQSHNPNELRRLYRKCLPVYRQEFNNHKHYKNTKIPTTCTLWYDGCNHCGVNHGKLTFCTRMECFRKGHPHCIKYRGIGVISKKPIKGCNLQSELSVLKSCESILKMNRYLGKSICHTPCMNKMIRFYNKCYNAPNMQNFFKRIDPDMIRPCEQGTTFHHTLPPTRIGGTRDSHKCVTSAGYTWCAASNKCVRKWETPCPVN